MGLMSDDTAVVVFADLVGFTALTDAHGDADAVVVADRLLVLAEEALVDGVEVVKTIGDAVMLRGDEIEPTLRTVERLVEAVHAEPRFPGVRVGMHVGSVIVRPGDLFGHTVNVAARLAGVAKAGEVVASRSVVASAGTGFVAHPLGLLDLRNVADPIEAFNLRPIDPWVTKADVDPVCRMRLDPEESHATRAYAGSVYVFCSERCAARFDRDPDRNVDGPFRGTSEDAEPGEGPTRGPST